MTWDDAKSRLLYDLFMKKVDESFPNKSQDLWGQWETRAKWHVFLKSIGVETFKRPPENPWTTGLLYGSPAKEDGEHILLLDPANPSKYHGLKMSKVFAEKLLILGIP